MQVPELSQGAYVSPTLPPLPRTPTFANPYGADGVADAGPSVAAPPMSQQGASAAEATAATCAHAEVGAIGGGGGGGLRPDALDEVLEQVARLEEQGRLVEASALMASALGAAAPKSVATDMAAAAGGAI